MQDNKNLEEMYGKFVEYERINHENNQKRIRVGIKVNIVLPLLFLIISFLTEGSKLVFLILWIVSLFGIAFYLVYVEYSDHKIQEKLVEFGFKEKNENEDNALIGQEFEQASERVEEINQAIEKRHEEISTAINDRKEGLRNAVASKVENILSEQVNEKDRIEQEREQLLAQLALLDEKEKAISSQEEE